MALLTEHVEQDDLGQGRLRNTIHMRKIAYRENGSLRSMVQSWEDGDVQRPHMVTRAPLMVSAGNDGMRRFHPTREADKYLEIGAPFVQVAGNWTQVNLGAPTRTNKRLTWQTANADFMVDFGGHFCKLEIELKNGYVPQNNRVAFPVGIQGLTRQGVNILDGGNVVAHLRPFVMFDAANEQDVRPIAHQFTTLNGQPYLLLTLPSLAGMARPVIDPTLTLQPNATDGVDTYLQNDQATSNFGTIASLRVGESNVSTSNRRSLIKFDLSSLPDAAVIGSSTFSLYEISNVASNARTMRVFRTKRAWVELQATWNIYSTGNSWSTAGGFHSDDCEQTDIGNRAFTSTEALNEFKDFSLSPTTKASLDLGNGWLLKMDTELDDAHFFASSDDSTAANRPKLVIEYTVPAGVPLFMASYRRRRES